jgi:3'-phosphoadenosine 5'-phosphosulfate sulfotransferase (PAPS reductase)/FAD synthetase
MTTGLMGMESKIKYCISSSYGNDSIALIQLAYELKLEDVTVAYCDTGWASSEWPARVAMAEEWVKSLGFNTHRIVPNVQFEELMKFKKGFPNQRYQWCSAMLKIIPFLNWLDDVDQDLKTTVMLGVRRAESQERKNTPNRIEKSERHGGRDVWFPLASFTDEQRNELLGRAGFDVLPHRSMECAPCINANRTDLRLLKEVDIAKVEALESAVGKTMFRPKRHAGAMGIRQVIQWANAERGQYDARQSSLFNCDSGMCGS